VGAASPASELESFDRDHFDAGLAERCVRARVPLVGDDDSGFETDNVVAVVPLLPLGCELVTARSE
jgi:hypothetical protein